MTAYLIMKEIFGSQLLLEKLLPANTDDQWRQVELHSCKYLHFKFSVQNHADTNSLKHISSSKKYNIL